MAVAQSPKTTDSQGTADEEQKIATERQKNAQPGFFLRAAVWLLSRFPLTKNKYQNWTAGRRILVGWLLWIVCLPIIPLVIMIIWYVRDPEGFKKSPIAKGLVGLTVAWLIGFGFIATSPSQLDQNGKYSPIQTQPDGETKGTISEKPATAVTEETKKKVADKKESSPTAGRRFANCTEAFDAGVFDIPRSDAAYDSKLDRDDDGIACER